MNGTVKWFDETKGYGFIISEETGKEYFVHWKSIVTISDIGKKYLIPGERVEFDTIQTDKGVQAINVIGLKP